MTRMPADPDPGATIDLSSVELWMGDPYPTLRWLRNNDPVHWHPAPDVEGGRPFWAVTKHDDVVEVSRNPEVFCSGQGVAMFEPSGVRRSLESGNMVYLDDPEHKWMRALVSRGFTPRTIAKLEPHVEELTTSILDQASLADECDFVADVAAHLPVFVIGEMLGMPRADLHLIKQWSDALTDTERTSDAAGMPPHALAALAEMFDYLARMQDERSKVPQDDLVSLLMTAEVDGQRLSTSQQQGFFLLLEFAGNETTRNAIAGGMLALSEHPAQRRLLADHPQLVAGAVEEVLRWTSPVTHFRRTARQDYDLRGRRIRQGDWVIVFYGSANRDEEHFEAPEEFEVTRSPNPHLAFGGTGPHFCLGAALSRLELRVMFEHLLRRFPDAEVTGPVERIRSNFIRGIKTMPVNLRPN